MWVTFFKLLDEKFFERKRRLDGRQGKKDKGKREEQKKCKQTPKEKRKQKKVKRNKCPSGYTLKRKEFK